MTLLERALRASGAVAVDSSGLEASIAISDFAAVEEAREYENLQRQVRTYVSIDDMAQMVLENPSRARSELKCACRQVFQSDAWRCVGDARRRRLVEQLMNSVFGFGPLEGMLADDTITEIMVNGPRCIFYERDGLLARSSQSFTSEEQLRALVDRILGPIGRRVDESSPLVNARLPEGHRVNVVIPPLAIDGVVMTIRKFPKKVMSLEEMMDKGSLDGRMKRLLEWAVRSRKSIAVSGGTGSGKTTLLNALSCRIPLNERIVTIEDSAELRFLEHPHVVRMEARPRNAEGMGEVTIRDLVINALRMRPDRIVVGECRGGEALDMLQAMLTGHDGSLTTLHANSPEECVSRLTTMVRYAVDLPVDVIEANIASAFDVVVQMSRGLDGHRYISEVAEFCFRKSDRSCQVSTVFRRASFLDEGMWFGEPSWIDGLASIGVAGESEVDSWRSSLDIQSGAS